MGCASQAPSPASKKCADSEAIHNGTDEELGPINVDSGGVVLCLALDTTGMPAAHLVAMTDQESGSQSSFTTELLDADHNGQLLVDGWDVTVGQTMPMTSQHIEWSPAAGQMLSVRYVLDPRDKPATTNVHVSLFVPLAD
jgi:hypothetical protein